MRSYEDGSSVLPMIFCGERQAEASVGLPAGVFGPDFAHQRGTAFGHFAGLLPQELEQLQPGRVLP